MLGARAEALGHGLLGCAVFCATWYLLVDVLALWRFRFLPSIGVVISQLFSSHPRHGISLLTPELYDVYFRAAACLGYGRWQQLRRIVLPGALPTIFTGLEIAMGVAWFSLVGGELIAGKSGLGYLIFDGYTQVALPNIVIGMIVLGALGYVS